MSASALAAVAETVFDHSQDGRVRCAQWVPSAGFCPRAYAPSAFPPTCHWPRSARSPHSPPAVAEEQVEKPWDPPHKQTSTKGADELRGGRGNDVVRHGRKGDDRFAFALEAAGAGLPSGGASCAATAATSPLRAVPRADCAGRSRCPVRTVRDQPGTDTAATGTTDRAARRRTSAAQPAAVMKLFALQPATRGVEKAHGERVFGRLGSTRVDVTWVHDMNWKLAFSSIC